MPKYINVNIERGILSKERKESETILSMERTFQEWLEIQLNKRGWTQNQLAQKAGLASGTLSNIMSGNRKISFDTCVSIAEAFSLPPEVVARAAGLLPPLPEGDVSDELKLFNQQFAKLDAEDREDIMELIQSKIKRKQAREQASRRRAGHTGPFNPR